MGVAKIEPREASEKPITKPFKQHPKSRKTYQHAAGQGADKLHIAPRKQCMQQCQCGTKQCGQSRSEENAGVAVDMDADVDPRNSGTEHAQAEKPTAPQALPSGAGTE